MRGFGELGGCIPSNQVTLERFANVASLNLTTDASPRPAAPSARDGLEQVTRTGTTFPFGIYLIANVRHAVLSATEVRDLLEVA